MRPHKISAEVRAELSMLVASASIASGDTVALERLVERISVLPPKSIYDVEDLVDHLTH
jgi:hypothetical protein